LALTGESNLNTEGKECETGHLKRRSVVRGERVNEEGKAGYS
jgi:hypothetical protein